MFNSRHKNLLNQSALYALSIFLMKGISLVMLPIYTHYLTPEDYGRLEILVVFSNIASLVLSFGLVDALYRFVGLADSIEKKRHHASECLLIAGVISITSFILFFGYSEHLAGLFPGNITENEVFLLGITLSIDGLINIPLAWLRITERAAAFFLISMLKVIIQVSLTFYLLVQGWGITSILVAGAVSSGVVAIILCIIQLKETGLSLSLKNLRSIVMYSWPILIGGAATFSLSGLDTWLLAKNFGAADIAAYAVAIKFSLVPAVLIQPFTLWWLPKRFSVLNEKDGKSINAHFAVLGATISVIICAILGLLSPIFIHYLTPNEYHLASEIIPWLLICSLLKMLSDLLNLGCYVKENSCLQMNINIAACSLGAVLLFFLIPKFMITGALVSLIIANLTRTLLFYYFSQQRIYLPYKFYYFYMALFTAAIFTWLGQIII